MELKDLSITKPDEKTGQRLEAFRKEHADDPIGDIASRVLFEDDRVKIWDMKLEPGEATDLHHHERDYYLVMLQGDHVVGLPRDEKEETIVINLPKGGATVKVPKGGVEWGVNVGEETFYEILVELKS